MTKTYTYTEARQNLASVLAQAEQDGEVRITHRSGKSFVLRPETGDRSPLDVPGVDTGITRQEIIDSVREGREQDIDERRASPATNL
ncbi:MAG: type II toxin-antitoxin system prevent-host-death family antitoxin [Anaerolineales bacterium]|jgi:prevent-host-death family protein